MTLYFLFILEGIIVFFTAFQQMRATVISKIWKSLKGNIKKQQVVYNVLNT